MTRGNKKAFNIDAQRGEGASQREAALRGVPIEINETETPVVSASPAPSVPNADFLQTLANGGGAFAPSNDAKGFTESLTAQNNYEPVEPGQASNVNMILAAINDILGGSEEASAMIG